MSAARHSGWTIDLPVTHAHDARPPHRRRAMASMPAQTTTATLVRFAASVVLTLVAGCGAKSGLFVEPRDAAPRDTGVRDAAMRDAGSPDASSADAGPPDLGPPDEGPPDEGTIVRDAGCRRDEDCVDLVDCTRTLCGRGGLCLVTPDSTMCSDGASCNGVERCDISAGCVAGSPPTCADTIACSVDACDRDTDACTNTPDDLRCPISHRCDLVRGCVARVLAIDVSGGLFDVEVPSAATTSLGTTDRTLADIALAPDGTFYGAAFDELVRVDSVSGATTSVTSIIVGDFNALDFAPDGQLYGAGRDQIVRVDVASGAVDFIAVLPSGYISSGDLAFLPDGRMFLTTTRTGGAMTPDELFEIRLDGRAPRRVGVMGSPCVWGLASFGTTVYGLTCLGQVLLVDTATGGSRVLATTTARFGGAAAR